MTQPKAQAVVYLVGDSKSAKTNSWLAMTNDQKEAERLQKEIKGACCIKEVLVRPKGGKKNVRRRKA